MTMTTADARPSGKLHSPGRSRAWVEEGLLVSEPSHQLLDQRGPSTFEPPLTFPSLLSAPPQGPYRSKCEWVETSGRNLRLEPHRATVRLRLPGYLLRPPDATTSASVSFTADQPRANAWELVRQKADFPLTGVPQVTSSQHSCTPANLGCVE